MAQGFWCVARRKTDGYLEITRRMTTQPRAKRTSQKVQLSMKVGISLPTTFGKQAALSNSVEAGQEVLKISLILLRESINEFPDSQGSDSPDLVRHDFRVPPRTLDLQPIRPGGVQSRRERADDDHATLVDFIKAYDHAWTRFLNLPSHRGVQSRPVNAVPMD